MIGLVIAVLARSSAIAMSIGVGYVLVAESVLKQALGDSSSWLLGSTLTSLASGGTEALAYGSAGALALAYAVVGCAVALLVFTTRDVTD